jgi:outer membrane protein with beta-barrel domain
MKRRIARVVAGVTILVCAGRVSAQESAPRARSLVVTVIPGGATFFTQSQSGKEPGFTTYAPAGDVEFYLSHYVSVEGEVGGGIGVSQELQSASGTSHRASPSLVTYSGNVVVTAPSDGLLAPYLTAGAGGLTLLHASALGIADSRTFFTGNVGAGVKWFSATSRWGVRADYRFLVVRADDQAPSFFGRETRYASRAYGALLVNVGR